VSKLDIEKIVAKYDGIIPPDKLSFKKWLKADIRNKNDKAVALYKAGKTLEFISQNLNINERDLQKIIDRLYKTQKPLKEKQEPVFKAPENYSSWTSNIIDSWRRSTIIARN
jgi:uncharacterized membrane protein